MRCLRSPTRPPVRMSDHPLDSYDRPTDSYDPFIHPELGSPKGNETGGVAILSSQAPASFGAALRKRRLELRKNQKEFAQTLGLHPKTLRHWEMNRHSPSPCCGNRSCGSLPNDKCPRSPFKLKAYNPCIVISKWMTGNCHTWVLCHGSQAVSSCWIPASCEKPCERKQIAPITRPQRLLIMVELTGWRLGNL
jgi:DNA-binding XRE family transcriptional regulator